MAELSRQAEADLNPYPEVEAEEPLPFRAFTRRRIVIGLLVVLAVLLLAVVPPLFNVSRYKRQIASSIGASLGRPVHIDNVSLTLLPLPGFTLERFVVGEDPAFGAEPVLRADQVRATVRFRSLWHRRLEFSRIVLTDPSINLVHLPDGRWNLESILLRASHIPAAPTAQLAAGSVARFPYIEATGARLNLKQGMEKTPYSLTETDLALWLPEPGRWHFRLKAHPTRTDTAVSDTGVLRLDGTLGQAETLGAAPVELRADWTAAPLGAVSLIALARDAGMRGTMNLHASVDGRLGDNRVQTELKLSNVRRTEFVPERSMSAAITCEAHATSFFHTLSTARCVWPAETDGSGLAADFDIPDTRHPAGAGGRIQLHDVPLAGMLDAVRIVSDRTSPALTASGLLSSNLACCGTSVETPVDPPPTLTVTDAAIGLPDKPPFLHGSLSASYVSGERPALVFAPMPLDLGGAKAATLTVRVVPIGVLLQLSGDADPVRLHELVQAVPQLGDGLEAALTPTPEASSSPVPAAAPVELNLTGEHRWNGGQTWTRTVQLPPARRPGSAGRRGR